MVILATVRSGEEIFLYMKRERKTASLDHEASTRTCTGLKELLGQIPQTDVKLIIV